MAAAAVGTGGLAAPRVARGAATSLVQVNCQPVGFLPDGRLVYNGRNQDTGLWDAYVGGRSITSVDADLSRSHRGALDVKGYAVLLEGATGTDASQEPGKGVSNDVYVLDLSSSPASSSRLTSSLQDATGPRPQRRGTMWARFHPTRSRICWSEMNGADTDFWNEPLQYWEVHVADVVSGGLQNEVVYPPRGASGSATTASFYETYGWLPDGRILFASDAGTPPNGWGHWLNTQIWALPDPPSGTPERLSPSWPDSAYPYSEFAAVAPVGMFPSGDPWLLYSTTYRNGPGGGMDLWRTSLSGAGTQRVTSFNASSYAIVGQICLDPGDPTTIHAGVTRDANARSIDYYRIRP